MNTIVPLFTPSPHQQRLFDWLETGRGSAVVVAVAGSGKTTSVIRGLRHIRESASVQLLAFNSTIAKELTERVQALREETGRAFANVRASTFHSLGFGAVRKYLGKDVTVRVDGKKVRQLLPTVIGEEAAETYGDFVCQLVSLAKGQGVGALEPDLPAVWWDLVNHHDITLSTVDASEEVGIELARKVLAASTDAARRGWLDFDDQLYLVVRWKLRLWQNDFVFVDEAQDTNPVRRALAKLALRPGGRLVAVGDPRQAIYGFTGASHDAIDLIRREFNAIELPLTVCYRCSSAIVAHAREFCEYIEARPGAAAGLVQTGVPIAEAVKTLDSRDAILCRQTAPLIKLAYQLIARGTGCAVLGREIGSGLIDLVKRQRARGIAHLEEKLTAYRDREVAKFTAKGEELKAEVVSDRVECVMTVIEHLPETERTVPKLIDRISGLFSDTGDVLTLSTVHKAKGREWRRVAILRPDLMPSRWARQDWQVQQEHNLIYVARTRAMEHLMELAGDALGGEDAKRRAA